MAIETTGRAARAFAWPVLGVFTLTTFASAFLLFSVQPMFTKMVLPVLGGTPAVWAVAMVFFQAMLLLGYLYAHLSTRYLPIRVAVVVHLSLMLAALFLALPIGLAGAETVPAEGGHALWLVGVFLACVGLPFFAIAGNGPLLQAWFARTGHAAAGNPYRLAHASNFGSFAALMAYPLLMEPMLALGSQARLWTLGFVLLIVLILLAALGLRESARPATAPAAATNATTGRVRLLWVALAAVPSGLLGAVSTHIATDVASAPFLWVMPLSLYLLSFNAAFRERPLVGGWATPLVLGGLALAQTVLMGSQGLPLPALVACKLAGFFVLAVACHAALYRARPAASGLTEFYLWMSLGGVIGGAFASLAAPALFSTVLEYPLLLAAAVLLLPLAQPQTRAQWRLAAVAATFVGAGVAGAALLRWLEPGLSEGTSLIWLVAGTTLAALLLLGRQALASGVAVAVGIIGIAHLRDATGVDAVRSFFGVHRVVTSADGQWRTLAHGSTIHGKQRLRDADGKIIEGRPEPLSYYHVTGPQAELLRFARTQLGHPLRVGVVGLGNGSLACHAHDGDDWSFFEIDPEVVTIARDPARFTFLSECAPDARMVVGDARLTLAATPERHDVLIIDAFSSDAIPVHLLTREALSLYFDRLKPGGLLLLHISSAHMDLAPVVGATAAAAGTIALGKLDLCGSPGHEACAAGKEPSSVAALSRSPEALAALAAQPGWRPLAANDVRPWSDDYANVLGAILRRYRP